MAISYVGEYANGITGSGAFHVTLPAGSAAGDCAVFLTNADENANPFTFPSGSVAIFSGHFGADGQQYQDAYYFLTSTDITNGYVSASCSSSNATIVVAFLRGVSTSAPVNASLPTTSNTTLSSPATLTANSITTTANGCMLLFHAFPDDVNASSGRSFGTAPSGFTTIASPQRTYADSYAAYMAQSSAGATGNASIIYTSPGSSGISSGAALIAMAPAGGGSGALSGSANLAFTASATPTPTGAISGSANLAFTATATATQPPSTGPSLIGSVTNGIGTGGTRTITVGGSGTDVQAGDFIALVITGEFAQNATGITDNAGDGVSFTQIAPQASSRDVTAILIAYKQVTANTTSYQVTLNWTTETVFQTGVTLYQFRGPSSWSLASGMPVGGFNSYVATPLAVGPFTTTAPTVIVMGSCDEYDDASWPICASSNYTALNQTAAGTSGYGNTSWYRIASAALSGESTSISRTDSSQGGYNRLCYQLAAFAYTGGASGAISGTAPLTFTAGATATGVGALAGAAPAAFTAAATAAGKAAASGTASLAFAAGAALKGSGALAGSASLGFTAAASLKAAGALLGAAALAFTATGVPSGAGALAGSAGLAFTATGTASGPSGAVSGSAPLAFGATGTLTGSGAIVGAAGLAFAPSGTLTGSGKLAGAAPLTFTAIARPNGSSALAGSANLAFTATGALGATAAIAGAANLAFSTLGALRGTGALAGTAGFAFTASATPQAAGGIAGHAPLVFTAQATPSASAALGGVASFTFTAAGTLTNGLPSLPADPLYYVQMPPRAFYAALPSRPFYILSDPNMTPSFSNLDPRETEVLTFDASADLANGETLTTISVIAISVQSGPPTSTPPTLTGQVVNGAPVTLTVNGKSITIATGCCVQVVASGGVTGTQYLIAITCSTSNPDKVLTLKGILPISAQ